MANYTGRIGRPFDWVEIVGSSPPAMDVELPHDTGALLIGLAGIINLTMKNGSEISMDLPIGIIPGSFATVRSGGTVCKVFAARISV